MAEFTGFPDDTLVFLAELTAHNDREWFDAHRARYETAVREPARALIRDLGARGGEVTHELVADDRKSGGSLMRICSSAETRNRSWVKGTPLGNLVVPPV